MVLCCQVALGRGQAIPFESRGIFGDKAIRQQIFSPILGDGLFLGLSNGKRVIDTGFDLGIRRRNIVTDISTEQLI
jgi:hypothetical protein